MLTFTFFTTLHVDADTYRDPAETAKEPARALFDFLNEMTNYVPPTRTPTQTPEESTPNPTSGVLPLTEVSSLFEAVTQKIHNSCTTFGVGVVRRANNYCVEPIASIIGQTGPKTVLQMKYSSNSFDYLQCVGCAIAAAKATGKPYFGWGNAKQHAGQLVAGYTYRSSIQILQDPSQLKIGSLFVMTGGAYGHIGMVTEIDGSHGFRAFECNTQPGYVSHREKTRSFDSVAGFQIPL